MNMVLFFNSLNKSFYPLLGLFLNIILASCVTAQNTYIINEEKFHERQIVFEEADTIRFLLNSSDFNFNRPTAIYFTGSLPTPLILEWQDGYLGLIPFAYFNFELFLEKFNLVIVSKPFTPVCAKEIELVNSCYVPDLSQPNSLDENFLKSNNLTYLGRRGNFLVNWLVTNNVINTERILTIGHSQGGLEAVRVSSLNSYITDVVMLSAAPFGRMQHVSTKNFIEFSMGKIDFETYLSIQKQIHESIINAKEKIEAEGSDSHLDENILSFAEHAFSDMIKTKANIFYISGTKDMAAFYADQIMIDAVLHNKFNIKTKLYENFEHSFFKVEPSGEVNYEVDKWEDVFAEIMLWFESNTH